jgi:phage terminase small subunit
MATAVEQFYLPNDHYSDNEVANATTKLSIKQQAFVTAYVKSMGDGEYAIQKAGYAKKYTNKYLKELLGNENVVKAVEALTDVLIGESAVAERLTFNYKVNKLYNLIEKIATDPAGAKDIGFNASHMLDAIKTLNVMQGHNAPDKSMQVNYNVNNVKAGKDEKGDIERLIIEYNKEY